MIQITLGRHRLIDPREDAFGRSQIGWTEGLSDQQLHDIARGTWVMPGERVERERFAVVSGDVIIRQAMEIDRVVDTPDGRMSLRRTRPRPRASGVRPLRRQAGPERRPAEPHHLLQVPTGQPEVQLRLRQIDRTR